MTRQHGSSVVNRRKNAARFRRLAPFRLGLTRHLIRYRSIGGRDWTLLRRLRESRRHRIPRLIRQIDLRDL